MSATMMNGLGALLLTYLVHSTILLGGAALLSRYVARREGWRETLWKAALIGGLVTTAVATLVPRPLGARLELGVAAAAPSAPSAPSALEATNEIDVVARDATAPLPATISDGASDQLPPTLLRDDVAEAGDVLPEAPGAAASTPIAARVPWLTILLAAWLLGASALLIRLAVRHARLHRVLRHRREVSEHGLPAMLAELRRTAGVWRPVRLTTTPAIATPLVLGRSEICVPARFLDALGAEQQRAALAHELGHLARRDPAWQLAAMVLECVFFLQPLHRRARVSLRESAEYLADGWAVQHTGSRLGLAQCLAEVAGWVSPSDEAVLAGTMAMAEGGSPLLVRVRRLLEREPESALPPAPRLAVAVALLLVTAGFGPAIASGAHDGVTWNVGSTLATSQDIQVVRAPAGLDLAAALGWAESSAEQRGSADYWVAYALNTQIRADHQVIIDSESWDWSQLSDRGLAGALGVVDELRPATDRQTAIVLARMRPETGADRLERLALRTPELGMDVEGKVYWLGEPAPQQSFAWLSQRFDQETAADLRATAVDIISVHAGSEAAAFLVRVIDSQERGSLREQAVEGLAYHPSDRSVVLLDRLAREDRDRTVREEAAEALGETEHPRASAFLIQLARGASATAVRPDDRVREEALEGLVQRRDSSLAELLLDIALNDPDSDMRREAVESMEQLPADVAVTLLRRVIADARDGNVQQEAVESLGDLGTPAALETLEQVLAGTAGEDGAMQAVESIAEFRADVAVPVLQRVLAEHPSQDVRREALEELADMTGQTAIAADELLEMALHDDDEDLRRSAVELMAKLPPDDAVRLLRQVAFESGEDTAERQASESLGDVGTPAALEVLDEILAQNPGEDASVQAIEAIAENFSSELAIPRLREAIETHPSRRVRREAMERLADLDGGR